MLLDFSPLKHSRDYRYLYFGQFVSYFGSMMTFVAVPYQIFAITRSSLAVGLVSVAQLIPLLVTAFVGGAFADRSDRRKLIMISEVFMMLGSLGLMANSHQQHPSVAVVFLISAFSSGLTGFHRPSLESATQSILSKEQMMAVGILNSLKGNICRIAGPAAGGYLIARYGLPTAYAFDAFSFLASLYAIYMIKRFPRSEASVPEVPTSKSISDGLKYALSRQELIGTYVVDFIAMIFGMPNALFPAVAAQFGGAAVLGWFYSAGSIGALVANLTSFWTKKIKHHGRAVILSAIAWGVAIILFGLVHNMWLSLFCLGLAGGADMISVIFRFTIWNQTIPNNLRGRLAGLEMLSYMSGPMLGNAESGLVAGWLGVTFSILSGGVLCIVGVGACMLLLPGFWNYQEKLYRSENN